LLINNQNFILAQPHLNKFSFDESDRFAIIPIKHTDGSIGMPYFTSNPNLDELKNELCDNKADVNVNQCIASHIGEDKSNLGQLNQDLNDKLNEKMEKLNQKLEKHDSSDNKKDKTLSGDNKNQNDINDLHKDKQSSNDESNTNKHQDKQISELDKENKGKDQNSVNTEVNADPNKDNNKHQDKQISELDKENTVKGDKKGNNEIELNSGLGSSLEIKQYKENKIIYDLSKKVEKLKNKLLNQEDNQRLVQQREEDNTKDNNNNNNNNNDNNNNNNNKDTSHNSYDGYGFDGGNDNKNGNDKNDKNDESFNFAATGDFGCSKNTLDTVASIENKKPELVLPLGDLSYHSTADCWFDATSPLKGKMMITLGYHDTEDGAAKLNQYLNSFQLNKPYYSYDYKKVHFLIMASQSPYTVGSEQYNFVKQDLEKSSQNKDIEWIVVTSYGPFYTSPTTHNAEKDMRNLYHPLFEKYGVDLVLQAHNHNYQRTYPIAFNPNESSKPTVINGSTTGHHTNTNGIVFAIVGTGGEGFYPLQGQQSYVAKQLDGKFGFLNIDISNGNPSSKLTGTFYDNKGNVQDNFTLQKEIKGKTGDSNPIV